MRNKVKRNLSNKNIPHLKIAAIVMAPIWVIFSLVLLLGLGTKLVNANQPHRPKVLGVRDTKSYALFAAQPSYGDTLTQTINYTDTREYKLHAFFMAYRAPYEMLEAVPAFIQAADKYDLPWTLLPSIACKESGCGRRIPAGSYNPFGWAVYTGKTTGANFSSFSAAAWTVAKGLREDYFNRGLDTVPEIETRYTPPSANSHKGWQKDVTYFMNKLENWQL